ncbi:Sugar phosphate isomerase/epimerase [Caldanaerobius fijiensis DSM 17918]|uniref:Sugar phosphate isomerase/epimerase n=1 Tax=Caldanaerobius fijiensis DSM 17918 TaxID=1121256 RepID=A0A1M5EI56_9THEO|nr:sugar phosphate isomerase/epimerase [Caldanaerobius fijiensis]SHF78840.1 Sugar phosphate isomerase/epimerase [Caldanaerobius fijiensis DSM 17918]
MKRLPLGLQLYTLRDVMPRDFVGTLKKVADMGYDGVEFAGYGNLTAEEMKKYLDEFGLISAGSHVGFDALEKDLDGVLKYNSVIGTKYITCPYLLLNKIQNMDEFKKLADKFNYIGKKMAENGFVFCYHNHAHEFEKLEGKYVLDILFELTDPEYVKAEIDTYWVKKGGEDPVAFVKKYAGRLPIIHLKDLDEKTGKDTEILNGTINFHEIFESADELGIEWYIVEQEDFERPSIESAEISCKNLAAAGVGIKNAR